MWIWIFTVLFFLILAVLVLVQWKTNGGFKIETSWLGIALAPAVIWLLATGQLSEFSGFGLGFKLKQASAKPFSLNVDGDRIQPVSVKTGGKEGLSQIPKLERERIAALSFTLYRQGYYADYAIREYLERLTRHEFFKYVVFEDSNGRFQGLVPARRLLEFMRTENVDVARIIEEGAVDRLPGLIRASVPESSDKKDALEVMERARVSRLPVVDPQERFVGILERDKLASSILLQLVAEL